MYRANGRGTSLRRLVEAVEDLQKEVAVFNTVEPDRLRAEVAATWFVVFDGVGREEQKTH